MKMRKTWAATLLLLILPLSLLAREPMFAEPKNDPAQSFSLSVRYTPAAPMISDSAFSTEPASAIPLAPEKFTFRSLSRDFLKDASEIWSYPVHIRTRDILPIASLAILTWFLIGNDEAIRRGFMNYRDSHAWVRAVSPVITQMGAAGALGTAAAFLCIGLIAKDDKAVETAVFASSALLQSGILITFLKGLAGRQRPFLAAGDDRWSGPVGFFKRFGAGQYGKYDSFPGGHSISAFSLATVLAMQYRKSVWVPILAYTMATGVALSRLTEGKHWFSDCLVSSVLGCVIGRMVVLNHRSRDHDIPAAAGVRGSLSFAISLPSR